MNDTTRPWYHEYHEYHEDHKDHEDHEDHENPRLLIIVALLRTGSQIGRDLQAPLVQDWEIITDSACIWTVSVWKLPM